MAKSNEYNEGYKSGKDNASNSDRRWGFFAGSAASWMVFVLIAGGMWGCPQYNVWSSKLAGQAEFKKAEQNRLIQVEEAKANLESQKLNAMSEVERAKGMAEAIEIEDGMLTELYIKYLWVRNIDKMSGTTIYIPTEANLPILEARPKSIQPD